MPAALYGNTEYGEFTPGDDDDAAAYTYGGDDELTNTYGGDDVPVCTYGGD